MDQPKTGTKGGLILSIIGLVFSVGGLLWFAIRGNGAIFSTIGFILGAVTYKKPGAKVLSVLAMVLGAGVMVWAIFDAI